MIVEQNIIILTFNLYINSFSPLSSHSYQIDNKLELKTCLGIKGVFFSKLNDLWGAKAYYLQIILNLFSSWSHVVTFLYFLTAATFEENKIQNTNIKNTYKKLSGNLSIIILIIPKIRKFISWFFFLYIRIFEWNSSSSSPPLQQQLVINYIRLTLSKFLEFNSKVQERIGNIYWYKKATSKCL